MCTSELALISKYKKSYNKITVQLSWTPKHTLWAHSIGRSFSHQTTHVASKQSCLRRCLLSFTNINKARAAIFTSETLESKGHMIMKKFLFPRREISKTSSIIGAQKFLNPARSKTPLRNSHVFSITAFGTFLRTGNL